MKNFKLCYLNISASEILGGKRFNIDICISDVAWDILKGKGFKEKNNYIVLPDELEAVAWEPRWTHIIKKVDIEKVRIEKNSESIMQVSWVTSEDEFKIKIKGEGYWIGRKRFNDSP